jgi:hypothetical protein
MARRTDAPPISTNEMIAVLRGFIRSVKEPKIGLPPPLKIAKKPTSMVPSAGSIPITSEPTGFDMDIAIRPARHPMK